jgi:hypothetical protein
MDKSGLGKVQNVAGELLFRYDNAPHFPQLSTAPHHKHEASESNVYSARHQVESCTLSKKLNLCPCAV